MTTRISPIYSYDNIKNNWEIFDCEATETSLPMLVRTLSEITRWKSRASNTGTSFVSISILAVCIENLSLVCISWFGYKCLNYKEEHWISIRTKQKEIQRRQKYFPAIISCLYITSRLKVLHVFEILQTSGPLQWTDVAQTPIKFILELRIDCVRNFAAPKFQ